MPLWNHNFSLQYSQKTLHRSHLTVKYQESFMSMKSGLSSAIVIVFLYWIVCYISLYDNGAWLYVDKNFIDDGILVEQFQLFPLVTRIMLYIVWFLSPPIARWLCFHPVCLCVWLSVCLSVCLCLSRGLSWRFNYEGLVPHKQNFAGTLLGMPCCASYVSLTHGVIDDVTRSQRR